MKSVMLSDADHAAMDFAMDAENLIRVALSLSASLETKVAILNRIRTAIHEAGPFAGEPVDCVLWVESGDVRANDYNPNKVAPPEMELLRHSIRSDGYTQPVVGHQVGDGEVVVIDGFHRHRVGKECSDVRERVHGYLPVAMIKSDRAGKADRIGATIRHNRARGTHGIRPMTDIVRELVLAGLDDAAIGVELGMDADEVLRLKQNTGVAALFAGREFSKSWTGGS